eukprot:3353111-Prymnesium_polylepis.1
MHAGGAHVAHTWLVGGVPLLTCFPFGPLFTTQRYLESHNRSQANRVETADAAHLARLGLAASVLLRWRGLSPCGTSRGNSESSKIRFSPPRPSPCREGSRGGS